MNLVSKIFKEAIIQKENEYLKKNIEDKWRLNFHIMPPVGWLNDPNGLSYFKGIYNIFFQYSPFETEGGLKFWGHYQTKDLINYKYVGVSIYPDEKYDCHGVYSGSAFIEDNKLYIYYTGNVKETVYVDNKGNGIFYCNGGSVSIWVKKGNIYN